MRLETIIFFTWKKSTTPCIFDFVSLFLFVIFISKMLIFIFPWFSLVFRKHSMNKTQSISAGSTIFLSIFASFVHNFPIPFRSYFHRSIRRDFSQSACHIMESFIFPHHRGLLAARNPSVAISFPLPSSRYSDAPISNERAGAWVIRRPLWGKDMPGEWPAISPQRRDSPSTAGRCGRKPKGTKKAPRR